MTSMDTLHLVDSQLRAKAQTLKPYNFTPASLPAIRDAIRQLVGAMRQTGSADISVEERFVPGPEGAPEVRVLVITPPGGSAIKPAYMCIHGGGYVMGTADMGLITGKTIAREIDCVVISVDYRLAPETVHPGPVEDCYAALKWLHGHADELGVDPTRIAIGGESAGGGLTAALALLARDRGEVPLVFQLLHYPMLDDRTAAIRDPNAFAGEFAWIAEDNHFGWRALLGQDVGSAGVSPYAAAARATDLAGLPPAFIGVGALDLLVYENIDYAQHLLRAGVPTELHVVPGAFHGFHSAAPDADVSKRYQQYMLQALKRALQDQPHGATIAPTPDQEG